MRGNTLDNMHVTTQESMQDNILSLIEFCSIPRTRNEMQEYLGLKNREYFRKNILVPLINEGKHKLTIPDKSTSKNHITFSIIRLIQH